MLISGQNFLEIYLEIYLEEPDCPIKSVKCAF